MATTEDMRNGVDYALLESLRSTEHLGLGIRETFVTPDIGGAPSLGVLAEPIDGAVADLGWVFCHSQGLEQRYVEPLEVDLARGLAARGFRVLRFYCQGYGDSATIDGRTALSTHLRDSVDAIALMRDLGNSRLGFFGARFGAIVAALCAERHGGQALILWDPATSGKGYLRNLLRQDAVSAVTLRAQLEGWSFGEWDGKRGGGPDPMRELEETGVISVDGLTIDREAYDELMAVDLATDLVTYSGDSLVVQVSRNTTPRADMSRLVESLGARGGATFEAVAPVKGESAIGSARYLARGDDPDGRLKRDLQGQLSRTLVAQATGWAERLLV
jgi:pimeloyl-ACP methyl ester carboxylesterase